MLHNADNACKYRFWTKWSICRGFLNLDHVCRLCVLENLIEKVIRRFAFVLQKFSAIFWDNIKWLWLLHKIWTFVKFFWNIEKYQSFSMSLIIWYYSRLPLYTRMKICDHVIILWLLVSCSCLLQSFSTKHFQTLCIVDPSSRITLSLWWKHTLFYLNKFSSHLDLTR